MHSTKTDKQLFKVEELEKDQSHFIDVPRGTEVRFEGIMFRKDIVSQIEIFKYIRDEEKGNPCIFVELYMGNIEICLDIYHSDVVVLTEVTEKGIIRNINIRAARQYDY